MFAIFSLRRPDILPIGTYPDKVFKIVNQARYRTRPGCTTGSPSLDPITSPARLQNRAITKETSRPHRRSTKGRRQNQVELETEAHQVQKKCQGQGRRFYSR